MPTAIMAAGITENDPVISATMIITASGACATLPKQAIMATMMNTPGVSGSAGAPTRSASRHIAAPTNAPITMPGPKMPPEPPVPMDSDVATILATGNTNTIHSGIEASPSRVMAICTQPYPLASICGIANASRPTSSPPMAGLITLLPGSRRVSATVP